MRDIITGPVALLGDLPRRHEFRVAISIISSLFLIAQSGFAQSNVYSGRVVVHTPFYERIFFPKGSFLRPATFRGIDDLKPWEFYGDTNRIDRIFSDPARERTNMQFVSCLNEVPFEKLSLKCPGNLLTPELVRELLRDTVAIPRSDWINHTLNVGGVRYVFSLVAADGEEYVIDERPGAFALVFYPDGTYRCAVGAGYLFVDLLRRESATNRSQPNQTKTNQPPVPPDSNREVP